jgi:hypothetical protein
MLAVVMEVVVVMVVMEMMEGVMAGRWLEAGGRRWREVFACR